MSYLPTTKGITSTNNTTTTPLTNGSSFVGVGELNSFSDVMVQVTTDQNGILFCEFSPDGTNWDTSLTFIYDVNRINAPHVFVKGNRYFRVTFTNDSVFDQTSIRLYTYYGQFEKLTAPINGVLAENYDAVVTRPTNFNHEVAMSKRQGDRTWNKFGYNDDVDTGSEEIIASWGGSFAPSLIAETLDVESTSNNDISTIGTGVQSVVIEGIDANRQYQIDVVQTTGSTPFTTLTTWLGVNRVAPFLCGSTMSNEGTVSLKGTSSGDTYAEMPIGETVTQQAIFHVQSNHTFLLSWLHINVIKITGGGGQPEVTVRGYVFSPVANANIQVFKSKLDVSRDNNVEYIFKEPFPITESSVLYFTAETDTNNTSVDIRFSGIEERNM